MTIKDKELRDYYRDSLDGDAVCTVTEDEFVELGYEVAKDGLQIALCEVNGLPTCVETERLSMILQAQQLGQKALEPCVVSNPNCP